MPKLITSEMIQDMTLVQRKNLYANALERDTPAAHAVLELLARDDLMGKPAAVKTTTRKTPPAPRRRASSTTQKAVRAVHGRQV